MFHFSVGRNSSKGSKHIPGKCVAPGGHHDEDCKTISEHGPIETGIGVLELKSSRYKEFIKFVNFEDRRNDCR